MDIIWKKVKIRPRWKLLKGRAKIISNKIEINKNVKRNNHSSQKIIIFNIFNTLKIIDSMDKQKKRDHFII